MTSESIHVPSEWTLKTVEGRYEETDFQFELARTEASRLQVRLRGENTTDGEVTYELSIVLIDEDEIRVFPVESYATESTAMSGTESLLEHLETSVSTGALHLHAPDASVVESTIERFVYGPLRYRIRKLLNIG